MIHRHQHYPHIPSITSNMPQCTADQQKNAALSFIQNRDIETSEYWSEASTKIF